MKPYGYQHVNGYGLCPCCGEFAKGRDRRKGSNAQRTLIIPKKRERQAIKRALRLEAE